MKGVAAIPKWSEKCATSSPVEITHYVCMPSFMYTYRNVLESAVGDNVVKGDVVGCVIGGAIGDVVGGATGEAVGGAIGGVVGQFNDCC